MKKIEINWPNKKTSTSINGEDWLKAALDANIDIPTGCLNGSCGACEIEVNGEVIRACVSTISTSEDKLVVEFFSDPYW